MRTFRRPTRPANEESGVTLVELLISITIAGVVSVGLVGALTTLSISSDRVRKSGDAVHTLYTAADALRTLPYNAACPATYSLGSPAGFPADASTSGSGMRVTLADVTVAQPVIDVQYWNPVSSAFTTTCIPSLAAGDTRRLQRVKLSANLPDGRATRTLEVVKRG